MEATATLVMHKMLTNNYQIREETLEGRKHIVVPVVMIREGVHSGSDGPILHRETELSRIVEAWNGIPITIQHPAKDGHNVSANSPEVLESTTVGRVYHTRYEDGLKAEAWLDVERLQAISPEAHGYIMQGKPLDVSVGIFNDSEAAQEGAEWNGEPYDVVAINYRPDHLALLPGEQGACSWADGCGVRTFKEGGNMEDLLKVFKELNLKGFAVSPITNEEGYKALLSSLQEKLNGLDTNDRVYYLQEVYEDYFVYAVSYRESGDTTLYKRGYTANEGGVDLGEDSTEVRRKVEYVTMKMMRTKTSINNNEGGTMSKEGTLCCEAKVDALIANADTNFGASDKEWLNALKEEQLDKLTPVEPEKKEVTPVQVNSEEVIETFKGTLKTIEDYTALMPEAMKAQVAGGVKLYTEHRASLVKGILDKSGENFSEEKLVAMEDDTLESIFKTINPADYSGQGGTSITSNAGEQEGLLPAGVLVVDGKEEK